MVNFIEYVGSMSYKLEIYTIEIKSNPKGKKDDKLLSNRHNILMIRIIVILRKSLTDQFKYLKGYVKHLEKHTVLGK